MIIFKRRYCRKHGHDLDPDPGDLVLYCRRCHAMVDVVQAFEAERYWLASTRCGCGCGNPIGDA